MVNQALFKKIGFSVFGLGLFLAFVAVLALVSPLEAASLPFPAPTFLAPGAGTPLGQDRVWVGGVAKNGSLVKVFVDGKEVSQVKVRDHRSGTASFGVKLSNLSIGEHTITATGQDKKGKISSESNALTIFVNNSTPTPTLKQPVVNSDSGIERPFIIGNVQNGLEVAIIIDGKLAATFTPQSHKSGITSFSWQPQTRLALGRHLIEARASDKGKLSNHGQVFWQVGEAAPEKSPEQKEESKDTSSVPEPVEPMVKISEPVEGDQKLTVREDLESQEKPVVPDTDDSQGKIQSINEPEPKASPVPEESEEAEETLAAGDVKEVSPGAVVRTTSDQQGSGFKLNNSLIVGITILVFLLLSMVVWYVQERRDKLGEKVVDMFRESEESEPATIEPDQRDLPPPPPPMF